jgi:hypothetical protein
MMPVETELQRQLRAERGKEMDALWRARVALDAAYRRQYTRLLAELLAGHPHVGPVTVDGDTLAAQVETLASPYVEMLVRDGLPTIIRGTRDDEFVPRMGPNGPIDVREVLRP